MNDIDLSAVNDATTDDEIKAAVYEAWWKYNLPVDAFSVEDAESSTHGLNIKRVKRGNNGFALAFETREFHSFSATATLNVKPKDRRPVRGSSEITTDFEVVNRKRPGYVLVEYSIETEDRPMDLYIIS